jgi:glycosyltransferase involved in cell wall biosynthesis
MRIGIDCRLAGAQHAGIGRYIQKLVEQLVTRKYKPEVVWVLFFHDQAQAQEVLGKKFDRMSKAEQLVYIPIRHYSVAEQSQLPQVFHRAKLDLLHVPHFNVPVLYRGKLVVTIHDLLWHEYRGAQVTTLKPWQYWFKYLGYKWVAAQAVKKANLILVPAKTIQKTLERYYHKSASKIVVTKEGVDPIAVAPAVPKSQARQLLYVGSLYPHKNVRLVIDSLKQLPGYTLLIVGARNVFQDQVKAYVKQHNLEKRVVFLGYVSDQELAKVYHQVEALVQPSLSEGFGLTGVEAMAHKVPVLASNIPIFQEIYGDAATFFNPKSSESFVKAVQKLATINKQTVIKRGLKQVEQYSWQRMADETFTAYQKVLTTNPK